LRRDLIGRIAHVNAEGDRLNISTSFCWSPMVAISAPADMLRERIDGSALVGILL
jgi:hypothetical protein